MEALLKKWDTAMENGNPWAMAACIATFAVGFVVSVLSEMCLDLLRSLKHH